MTLRSPECVNVDGFLLWRWLAELSGSFLPRQSHCFVYGTLLEKWLASGASRSLSS